MGDTTYKAGDIYWVEDWDSRDGEAYKVKLITSAGGHGWIVRRSNLFGWFNLKRLINKHRFLAKHDPLWKKILRPLLT